MFLPYLKGVYNPFVSHTSSDSDNDGGNKNHTVGNQSNIHNSDSATTMEEEPVTTAAATTSNREEEALWINNNTGTLIDAESAWCNNDSHASNSIVRNRSYPQAIYAFKAPQNNSIEEVMAESVVQDDDENDNDALDQAIVSNCQKYRRLWIGVFLLLIVSIGIGTGIGAAWQRGTAAEPSSTKTTIDDLDSESLVFDFPWESNQEYQAHLLSLILQEGDKNESKIHYPFLRDTLDYLVWNDPTGNSPQSKALSFVAFEDGSLEGGGDMGYYGVAVPETNSNEELGNNPNALLLQRLTLLVLYYQTGGDLWSAPILTSTEIQEEEHGDATYDDGNPSNRKKRQYYYHQDQPFEYNDWATPGVDECYWQGVICDNYFHIVGLDLSHRGLKGSLPNELWAWLPHLTTLKLTSNHLEGPLPNEVLWPVEAASAAVATTTNKLEESARSVLPYLTHFDISSNDLTGSLPNDLSNGLISLQVLDLSDNKLTGPLPRAYHSEILEELYLRDNLFTGSLPFDDWWGELDNDTIDGSSSSNKNHQSIVLLDLQGNRLTGSIPWSLGTQSELEYLSLANNPQLRGPLPPPSVLGELTSLVHLSLSGCGLEGPVTESLGSLLGLPALITLSLADNHFTGSLPENIKYPYQNSLDYRPTANHPSILQELHLANNELTGSIPTDFFPNHLANVKRLQLSGNHISGTIPSAEDFPSGLVLLWLQNNPYLNGTMPCSLLRVFDDYDEREEDQFSTTEENSDLKMFPYDYRADCETVECPCCRRCYGRDNDSN